VRVSVAAYASDYLPGSAAGGVPDDPSKAEYHVYKLNRRYLGPGGFIDVMARDAALADYNAGAVPHGAPAVTIQPDSSLSTVGDQMLWSVYNELGKGPAHDGASSVRPLGIEVQQTTWAYDRPEPSGNSIFIRFKLI